MRAWCGVLPAGAAHLGLAALQDGPQVTVYPRAPVDLIARQTLVRADVQG